MKTDRLRRRSLLVGAGGACLALPVLSSVFAGSARAESVEPRAPRALRFFAIKSYSTQRVVDWYPRFSGNGYRVRPFNPNDGKADGTTLLSRRFDEASGRHRDGRHYFARFAPLRELAAGGSLSAILGPSLNPYLDQLLLIRGLDFMPDTSHNDGGMLGNYAASDLRYRNVDAWPTIDQTLAFSRRIYPHTPLGPRSLHLSLSHRNTCAFTDNGVRGGPVIQMQAHTDPRTAFREVFGSLSAEERAERKKLVDRVLEDYRTTRKDPRLSARDRLALERHVALLSELEDRLTAQPARQCRAPAAPASGDLRGVEVDAIARTTAQMLDLAVAAIRCDLTRVVTFDVWKAIGRRAGPDGSDLGFAHSSAKDARDWHERAHEFGRKDADDQVRAINEWIAGEVFARVLAGLSEEEEDGETYLDRSLVFWGNELGMNHMNYSVPALLAGRAGGKLKTGNYVDYIDWDQPLKGTQEHAPVIEGVPHNRLLVSLLRAFGLRPSDYERPGQPGYGSYKTTGKTEPEHALDYDVTRHGQPLPGLLA